MNPSQLTNQYQNPNPENKRFVYSLEPGKVNGKCKHVKKSRRPKRRVNQPRIIKPSTESTSGFPRRGEIRFSKNQSCPRDWPFVFHFLFFLSLCLSALSSAIRLITPRRSPIASSPLLRRNKRCCRWRFQLKRDYFGQLRLIYPSVDKVSSLDSYLSCCGTSIILNFFPTNLCPSLRNGP